MTFNPRRPYNDLPELPPHVELESKAVLKAAIGANRALAELKGVGELVPNQAVLVQSIGLQEAKLSSEIENIVTTNDELYRAFANHGAKAHLHTKEVLRYQEALWHGFSAIRQHNRPLTTNLYEELFQIIKQTTAGVRKTPGTKLTNSQGDIIYTPPEGEAVLRQKLANFEKFIYAEDGVDPLVKLAVIHYQFEAIHPFTDGNGRTGRIINILYLIEHNLLEIPILYLSRYIIENKNDYYAGLRGITERQAWEDWILYLLRGVEITAQQTRAKILSIRDLMFADMETVRTQLPKVYSKELLELLYRQPYCKIRFLEEAGIAHRQTASSYLKSLEHIGILRAIKAGREVYYINQRFLDLLSK
ncbi:Fic family protein [Chrysiogenes arsenatis]|uniref:Fic family protein n=1 Tax=Chrysiogenes arsenatis TaxID=309797 RepID=UPI000410D75A|nr:Fic family protein [Chrysiogenes arsenatis]